MWNEFTNGLVLSYDGPFVFEQGKPLDDSLATKNLITKIMNKALFEELNKMFNYDNWRIASKIEGSTEKSIGEKMEFDIRVDICVSKNTADCINKNAKFIFTQNQQLTGTQLLEEVTDLAINYYKYSNYNGYSISGGNKEAHSVYTTDVLSSENDWKDLNEDDILNYQTKEQKKVLDGGINVISTIPNVQIEVKKFTFIDKIDLILYERGGAEVKRTYKRYEIEAKMSLQSDPNVFINTTYFVVGYAG